MSKPLRDQIQAGNNAALKGLNIAQNAPEVATPTTTADATPATPAPAFDPHNVKGVLTNPADIATSKAAINANVVPNNQPDATDSQTGKRRNRGALSSQLGVNS